jgi:glycosyltransferase involved in cell wall biosynthesis
LPQQLFDIGVLTSANEGFPNSLVEASAAAIPLVTTRVGGAPDLLVEGATGLGVEVGDVHDTRRALLTLLTDEIERRGHQPGHRGLPAPHGPREQHPRARHQ